MMAPGNLISALACFSVVTDFPGKFQILYFFSFPIVFGKIGEMCCQSVLASLFFE